MSPLEFVEPSKDLNVNVLLYGGPKTGKTVGACTAPGPILLVNADRPNASRYAHAHAEAEIKEVKIHGLQTLIDVVNEVNENPGKYKSVVVDPVGELHRQVLEGMSGRAIRPKLNDYGDVSVHIERFCRALCDQPLTAVFTAIETKQKDEDSGGFEKLPWTGTSNPALGSKISAMVDIIGYTGVIQNAEGAEVSYVAQLQPGGGRNAGARFGDLGAVRDVNINEWVKLAQAELAQKGAAS
jgi:phage nucleotide-binding protein